MRGIPYRLYKQADPCVTWISLSMQRLCVCAPNSILKKSHQNWRLELLPCGGKEQDACSYLIHDLHLEELCWCRKIIMSYYLDGYNITLLWAHLSQRWWHGGRALHGGTVTICVRSFVPGSRHRFPRSGLGTVGMTVPWWVLDVNSLVIENT